MTSEEITAIRLEYQQISQQKFSKPEDVVTWMGAVQSQDFQGGLWGIGLRTKGAIAADVLKAIESGKIVRTWPMRGTLHFIAAQDARWMLELMTPRIKRSYARRHEQLRITSGMLERSRTILTKALTGGNKLTRPQIYELFEQEKIPTEESRGLHILGRLAHDRLIIFGPHAGKQATFVLFDEWIPKGNDLKGDEALTEIAKRYFQSHGPATDYDFAWWTGLTLGDARKAMELSGYKPSKGEKASATTRAYLLPPFDEYIVAYKDRTAIMEQHHGKLLNPGANGMLSPTIIIDGRVVGTWKRSGETQLFRKLTTQEKKLLDEAFEKYRKFLIYSR